MKSEVFSICGAYPGLTPDLPNAEMETLILGWYVLVETRSVLLLSG